VINNCRGPAICGGRRRFEPGNIAKNAASDAVLMAGSHWGLIAFMTPWPPVERTGDGARQSYKFGDYWRLEFAVSIMVLLLVAVAMIHCWCGRDMEY